MTDERHGLPSISQLEAMSLCPARFQMCQQVTEPPTSPEAQYGIEVAKARETGDTANLTPDQRDLVADLRRQEATLLKEIFGKEMPAEEYREQRFWYLKDPSRKFCNDKVKLFSGRLDYAAWAHSKERVSVYFDDKSLWGDMTPSPLNMQLRGGAVLMKQNFGSRRAFVAILQPTKSKYAVAAEYGTQALEQAEEECVQIVTKALRIGAQDDAVPGPEQCRYCRAKLVCKVAHKESVEQLATAHDTWRLKVADLTADDLDRLGWSWEVAQIIGEAVDAEIKRRKEADPDSMPNYEWKENGCTSQIEVSPGVIYPRFKHLLNPQAFAQVCKVQLGTLIKQVQDASGYSAKDARFVAEKLLGELLIKTPKKPSLKRKPYYQIK